MVESENCPPCARNWWPPGRGSCLLLGVQTLRPLVLPGFFFLFPFGLRSSRPPPSRWGCTLRLQLRTGHLEPPRPAALVRSLGRAPPECQVRNPLTLLSFSHPGHDPPRAPTLAWNCKALGAGNSQPGARLSCTVLSASALPGPPLSSHRHWVPHNPELQRTFRTPPIKKK